jgi:putative ATP-dependent endonuclease of OLD family
MYISRLFVKNFRNLRHFDAEIGEGVTCFIGENNSGKTNLLRALQLVLDGNISAQRRRLQPQDLASGLSFATPEHVLIAVEFSDFAGRANEEALPFTAILENGRARVSYRFRPKATRRETIEQLAEGEATPKLSMDDYVWELAAGGDNVDLNTVTWKDSFGTRFSTDTLQQGYLVVLMEALRDVETRLAAPRTSPLRKSSNNATYPTTSKPLWSDIFKLRMTA